MNEGDHPDKLSLIFLLRPHFLTLLQLALTPPRPFRPLAHALLSGCLSAGRKLEAQYARSLHRQRAGGNIDETGGVNQTNLADGVGLAGCR